MDPKQPDPDKLRLAAEWCSHFEGEGDEGMPDVVSWLRSKAEDREHVEKRRRFLNEARRQGMQPTEARRLVDLAEQRGLL